MIDQVYSWFTVQDTILFISLLINLGLFIDYLDKKIQRRKEKRKCLKH